MIQKTVQEEKVVGETTQLRSKTLVGNECEPNALDAIMKLYTHIGHISACILRIVHMVHLARSYF